LLQNVGINTSRLKDAKGVFKRVLKVQVVGTAAAELDLWFTMVDRIAIFNEESVYVL
jgi:hypothetical protein